MGWLKPSRLLVIPLVFVVAVPLAICAGLTTILAFLVLFFRLFLVYFDLAIDTLRYVVLGRSIDPAASRTPHTTTPAPSSPTQSSPRRRRNRRDSSASSGVNAATSNLDGASLSLGSALERDFEGVGGWRLKSADADPAGTDEQQWYSLNSRLEMPDRKHHFRTQSGGDIKPASRSAIGLYGMKSAPRTGGQQSPQSTRLTTSPNQLRSKTPTGTRQRGLVRLGPDGYFPPYESKPVRRIAV